MGEVAVRSECTRLPCEVPPMERQSRSTDLSDMAQVLTVERCYPGAIDVVLEQDGDDYDGLLITRFIGEKYEQALLDFGFAQARGLELGLLVRSARHCESKTDDRCASCLLNGLGQDFGDRIAQLKEQALSRSLTHEEFLQISRWAAEAASAMPEAYEANEQVQAALGHV